MKQEYAALKLGVTRQSLSNWENNKNVPSVDVIIKMAELYQTDCMSLIDHVQSEKRLNAIIASRSTYICCMVLCTVIALAVYIKWNNLIFAVIAGVVLPLLLFSTKIFANEFQSVPEHIFYVLFNDSDYVIPHDKLKEIGTVETVTNRSIKIDTDVKEPELLKIIEEKLQLQENQFSIIDPTKFYFIRR